jgi:hypothetical protein
MAPPGGAAYIRRRGKAAARREGLVQRYVIAENIRRFRARLAQEPSAAERKLLQDLLREEERKLAALEASGDKRKAPGA